MVVVCRRVYFREGWRSILASPTSSKVIAKPMPHIVTDRLGPRFRQLGLSVAHFAEMAGVTALSSTTFCTAEH